MTKPPTVYDCSALRKRPTQDQSCIAAYGGIAEGVVQAPEIVLNSGVIRVDSANPLKVHTLPPDVYPIAVCAGETTLSVTSSLGVAHTGAVAPLDNGADADISIGHLAGVFETRKADFAQKMVKLWGELKSPYGGQFNALSYAGIYGAGGSSNGCGPVIEDALLQPLRAQNTRLNVDRIRIGAITSALFRTDDRLSQISAAGLVSAIAWLQETPANRFETRAVTIVELPCCGGNGKVRSRQVEVFVSAYLCEEVAQFITEYRNAANNAAGRVNIVTCDAFRTLSPATTAATCAQEYSGTIRNELATPPESAHLTVPLEPLVTKLKNTAARSAEDILKMLMSKQARVDEILAISQRSPFEHQVEFAAAFAGLKPIKLTTLAAELDNVLTAKYGHSFEALRVRRSLLHTINTYVTKLIGVFEVAQKRAQQSLAKRVARYSLVLFWVFAITRFWLARIAAFGIPKRTKAGLFARVFAPLAKVAAELAQHTAVLAVLRSIKLAVDADISRTNQLLTNAAAVLDPYLSVTGKSLGYVQVLPLNEAWAVLRQMQPSAAADLNEKTLSRLATFVTAQGLAWITQATDTSADAIVAAATSNSVDHPGPVHGGRQLTPVMQLVVLPPTTTETHTALHHAWNRFAAVGVTLHFADSCVAPAVVRLTIARPRPFEVGGFEDLFAGSVRTAFKETIRVKNQAKFYPTDFDLKAAEEAAKALKISFTRHSSQPRKAVPPTQKGSNHARKISPTADYRDDGYNRDVVDQAHGFGLDLDRNGHPGAAGDLPSTRRAPR